MSRINYEALEKTHQLVKQKIGKKISLTEIATASEMSKTGISSTFRSRYSVSPITWLWILRTILAADIIAEYPILSIREVSKSCGFTSNAHFSRRFRKHFDKSPSEYRLEHPTFGGLLILRPNSFPSPEAVERSIKKLDAALPRREKPRLKVAI